MEDVRERNKCVTAETADGSLTAEQQLSIIKSSILLDTLEHDLQSDKELINSQLTWLRTLYKQTHSAQVIASGKIMGRAVDCIDTMLKDVRRLNQELSDTYAEIIKVYGDLI